MIREARKEDLDQIETIVSHAKVMMAESGMTQWGDTYPLRNHYESDLKRHELFVYEQEQQVIGVACISNEGHEEYKEINWSDDSPYLCIKRLAVDLNKRHKGIGLAFYRFAENLAIQQGIPYIRTDTNGENEAALNLFKKGNYTLVDRQHHGNFKEPFFYYEKKV
ncbi:GNAT family N-acetyltransferase [Alkalibacillus silvisoli]|uniref:N-acetyltransferase domain-containing protein n=1 Tax=Alkalibacillus silvisoli TaxID=392823 RepID=A0ABN0ZM45_9BACI